MDQIVIQGLRIPATIGVHAWEQAITQTLRVDIGLEADLSRAAASDDLADSIDYHALAESVRAYAAQRPTRLIESLAAALAERILDEFPAVVAVTLTVHKPTALPHADRVGATLTRRRPSSPAEWQGLG